MVLFKLANLISGDITVLRKLTDISTLKLYNSSLMPYSTNSHFLSASKAKHRAEPSHVWQVPRLGVKLSDTNYAIIEVPPATACGVKIYRLFSQWVFSNDYIWSTPIDTCLSSVYKCISHKPSHGFVLHYFPWVILTVPSAWGIRTLRRWTHL